MNQDLKDEILASMARLNHVFKSNTQFRSDRILNRLNEIEGYFSSPVFDLEALVSDLAKAFGGLKKLMEIKIPHNFLSLLIADSAPRFRNANLIYMKLREQEGECRDNIEPFNFKEDFKTLLSVSKTNKLKHIQSNELYGAKTALEGLLGTKVISDRARWLVKTTIQSKQFDFGEDWETKIIKKIENQLDDKQFSLYTRVLDSKGLTAFLETYNYHDKRNALICILSMSAYSHACNDLNTGLALEKSNFPILTNQTKKLTQKYLKSFYDVLLELPEIETHIRMVTSPESQKFKKFIFSQKKFQ